MSAYILPTGNVQISFSGGRTSAYMLHQIIEANAGLPERCRVVFSNTGKERPQTLDFVRECGVRWGINIVWVEDGDRSDGPIFRTVSHDSASRDGEPFERLIRRKKACPDQSKRFCTEHLKILPARRYLISEGWKGWTNAVGFRADEPTRLRASPDKRVVRWFPLADAGVSVRDVWDFWETQPFDLALPKGGGNCTGCFLKSEAQLAALARDEPDQHDWWERMEALASSLASSGVARFRSEYSRQTLREMVERQGDWIFDMEGALCQANWGECNG